VTEVLSTATEVLSNDRGSVGTCQRFCQMTEVLSLVSSSRITCDNSFYYFQALKGTAGAYWKQENSTIELLTSEARTRDMG
jgi:hypothetical protein